MTAARSTAILAVSFGSMGILPMNHHGRDARATTIHGRDARATTHFRSKKGQRWLAQ